MLKDLFRRPPKKQPLLTTVYIAMFLLTELHSLFWYYLWKPRQREVREIASNLISWVESRSEPNNLVPESVLNHYSMLPR